MKSCTYNATPDKKKSAKNPHNQFSDQHVAKGIILDKHAAPVKPHEKDFACTTACEKEGLQFNLCEERCARP